ncbi:endonuclease/exonuclease/phosphatase family protein [Pontibacter qinzhouensis]|uniref:Endonuclease/exonuclease/phosphatase family protein n=1 Tax=Pontibacter qinzhouensis TaxID=2603253 RepID=A0A5C8K9R9_9BACT|nr:endonuclease/exonuclease/phosphatase family protein [Pontibacter qinzhouensis]TXK45901.1 endonuclease/exonuclease/phosphatase family protein [Pontibacter qinzhouensis]
MKIVTWNCNGALRNKFRFLLELEADIFIIQECENPEQTPHLEYTEWSKNHLWIGGNKNKGLGIFAAEGIKMELLAWSNVFSDHAVKYFLPCLIDNDFQLVGVWAHQNNSPNFGYIGQIWKYLLLNKQNLEKVIIAGDFNSNAIWDQWDRWWNHSDVVKDLLGLGIVSMYHKHFKQNQGEESKPTFFLNRNLSKPYHIDYVFGSREFEAGLLNVDIGDTEKWLRISDHLPLICNFEGGGK